MKDVPSKYSNTAPVKKPEVVINYTKHMGGMDRSDHMISNYQFMRRTKIWYRNLFFVVCFWKYLPLTLPQESKDSMENFRSWVKHLKVHSCSMFVSKTNYVRRLYIIGKHDEKLLFFSHTDASFEVHHTQKPYY